MRTYPAHSVFDDEDVSPRCPSRQSALGDLQTGRVKPFAVAGVSSVLAVEKNMRMSAGSDVNKLAALV